MKESPISATEQYAKTYHSAQQDSLEEIKLLKSQLERKEQ